MNVLYFLNSTYALGGASKSFVIMLDGLMKKGIYPIVVLPDRGGLYDDLARRGVEVIAVTYRINTYPHVRSPKDFLLFLPRLLARRWVNRRAVRRLSAALHERQIALIHTNVSVVDIGFRLSRRFHVPHIYHIREYGDLDFGETYFPSWKAFHDTLSAHESYAICITKGILFHHHLQGSADARVIYNGLEPVAPDTGNVASSGYFLYVGRVEAAKGLDMLLEAYRAYWQGSSKRTPLWIVGDRKNDVYNIRLDEFIKVHELKGYVLFLGGRKDVHALMRKAKAIIIPSRMEAFGRCMAEAMLDRCLVIGHDTGGTKEQFDNGLQLTGKEIGLRFGSTGELARIMGKMDMLPSDNFREMVERAYRTACAFYSVEGYVSNVYEFYCDILDEDVD